jgi:hypothetical protein
LRRGYGDHLRSGGNGLDGGVELRGGGSDEHLHFYGYGVFEHGELYGYGPADLLACTSLLEWFGDLYDGRRCGGD